MTMPTVKRRSRIAREWRPDFDEITFAENRGIGGARLEEEIGKFVDFHLSRGSLMMDWPAAFRTWIRNLPKYGGASGEAPLLAIADPWGCQQWARSVPYTRMETVEGKPVICLNGYDLAGVAAACCEAAGLPPEWRGDLDQIGYWLAEGISGPNIISAVATAERRPDRRDAWKWYNTRVRGSR